MATPMVSSRPLILAQVDLDNFGRFFFDRDPTYFPVRAAVVAAPVVVCEARAHHSQCPRYVPSTRPC